MYVLTERLMAVHAYNYTFVCTVPTGFGPGIANWGVLEFFSLDCSTSMYAVQSSIGTCAAGPFVHSLARSLY